ncbi:MAG: CBS domain-containing protein, partial [Ruthenibacterium sp.]
KCVQVENSMDDLVDASLTQNFVPVIDGKNSFIGIVKRNSIIRYCYEKAKAAAPAVQEKDT